MTDEEFRAAFCDAVHRLAMGEQEVADALYVSAPTVRRWLDGTNLPHPALRGHILTELSDLRVGRLSGGTPQ